MISTPRLVLALGGLSSILVAQGANSTWVRGDVFAGTGASTYKVYDNNGVFKETIASGGSSTETTGGAFDSAGNLWTTEFSTGQIAEYDGTHPHTVIRRFNSQSGNESIVFNATGEFFSGSANGDRAMRKYDNAGNLLETLVPAIGPRGTDWIDLASDQRTMFYSSEGPIIRRFDVVSRTQLANFASVGSINYALRLLPPFDGSGGLLVASTTDIKRLDGTGAVIQTYDAAGQNQWFAMNLDPDGTSFWGGDISTHNFYKFNIASGAILVGPINTGALLSGLIVKGEITGGNTPPDCQAPPVVNGVNNVPISFNVIGTDVNVGDTVTLSLAPTSDPLPAGASMTPPLPQTGNPVTSQFNWTPTFAQIGTYNLVFRVRDRGGLERDCPVLINVRSECLLLFAGAPDMIDIGERDYLLLNPGTLFHLADVIERAVPTLPIPNWSALQGVRIYAQVIMFNDFVFPNDPVKVSNGLEITLGGGDPVPYGTSTGLNLWTLEPTPLGGRIVPRFRME